jgi:hypothetical protein
MDGGLVEVFRLMPLVIHPRIRKAVGRVAALTVVGVFASAGAAFASCSTPSVSTPFAQFGDTSNYFLVPGGSFEGSAAQVGWTLSGAQLTPGNEPYDVGGQSDDQSLTINSNGSATSPSFCIDSTMPDLRFFAQDSAPGSDLEVQAVFFLGRHQITWPLAVIKDGTMSSWAPVPPVGLHARLLPSWIHIPVQLRFAVTGGGGSWQVDDVYVDPFRLG